ncbi:LD-carboxypeptidase [Rhizobium sp. RU35A]|nr:LD-carboxypeptidase [Rhizobium sp. RU35A]
MMETDYRTRFARLRSGDRVRFVSPASTPDRDAVLARAASLEAWGLDVEYGPHAFVEHGWFAGTDDQRLADLDDALRDPEIRAVFATRGGRGSYRIADRLDFEAIRRDPKPLIGFSDITALHMAILRETGLGGVHGALYGDSAGALEPDNADILHQILFGNEAISYAARPEEPTFRLTTTGTASGPLIGGNLETLATTAGWALPDLRGAILLLEAVDCMPGLTDRMLTLLAKGGHLAGVAGIAVGQFTLKSPEKAEKIVDLVRDHLYRLGVPVLGGLPFGHGMRAQSVRLGAMARLDADAGSLIVEG